MYIVLRPNAIAHLNGLQYCVNVNYLWATTTIVWLAPLRYLLSCSVWNWTWGIRKEWVSVGEPEQPRYGGIFMYLSCTLVGTVVWLSEYPKSKKYSCKEWGSPRLRSPAYLLATYMTLGNLCSSLHSYFFIHKMEPVTQTSQRGSGYWCSGYKTTKYVVGALCHQVKSNFPSSFLLQPKKDDMSQV